MVPYAKRMEKMAFTANVVKGLFGSMTNPDIISFSGGSPAREALPVDTIRQLADEVLRTDTRGVEALQYGPIEGIRDLREDADLTQAQVGERLGLSQRTYAYYESGQRMVPPEVLCALGDLYGVSVDYLLGRTDRREMNR